MRTDTFQALRTPSTTDHTAQTPNPWNQVCPGVLFFLIVGVSYALLEAPRSWISPETRNSAIGPLWLGSYLFVLAGALIGWLRGFPRWSYPYLTNSLIFAMYISAASTPGIVIFGVPVWGEEAWGIRACLPLLVVFLLGFSLTRDKPPLPVTLIQSWLRDVSQLAFAFYGLLPLIFLISLDEVDNQFTFPAVLFALLLITSAAAVYLRAASRPVALIALFAGAFAGVYVVNLVSDLYWALYEVDPTTLERWRSSEPLNIWRIITRPMMGAFIISALMALLLLFGQFFSHRTENLPDEKTPY